LEEADASGRAQAADVSALVAQTRARVLVELGSSLGPSVAGSSGRISAAALLKSREAAFAAAVRCAKRECESRVDAQSREH
jgi:hypothetical protein